MDGTIARRHLRTTDELIDAALAPEAARAELERVAARYAVAITPAMLDAMDPAAAADPLIRQFVPTAAELNTQPHERADPIGDRKFAPLKGIVHRYPDRVLLKPIHTCPVYCRFCFRRESVGPGGEALTAAELDAAINYIRARPEIWEVILSGGDPLILSPRRLKYIIARLEAIAHVAVIRIHSRVPAVDPERIGEELLSALDTSKALFVVLHANHANELTAPARTAIRRIVAAGIPMLGQSVLLKGVNDDPAALEQLLRALVANRVKPYYLHQLDAAPGTSHFEVPIARGQELMRSLRGRVSGLCQPSYVLDIPGGHGKSPIGPNYLGSETVEDWQGNAHALAR
ncbi:MAG: lysine-2,3-aminomutase-like protein [Alphaproteobacteria bacterium]